MEAIDEDTQLHARILSAELGNLEELLIVIIQSKSFHWW